MQPASEIQMKCDKVIGRLLRGVGLDDDSSTANHLNTCERCRRTKEIIDALAVEGEECRKTDLSLGAVRETRRRAAHILAHRKEQGELYRLPIISGRWAAVTASAMLLVLAGVLVFVNRGGPGESEQRAGKDMAVAVSHPLDRQIEALQHQLTVGFDEFKKRYAGQRGRSRVEIRADRLRTRIELCFLQIEGELEATAKTAEQKGKGKSRIEEREERRGIDIEEKDGAKHESTIQSERDDYCLFDSSHCLAVWVAGGMGRGPRRSASSAV